MTDSIPHLADIVLSSGSSVAVVGMAKNCGKTVTLGAIVASVGARGIPVGVASAGRDGEATDAVTMLPKPPILLPGGALVATAEKLAPRAQASLEPMAVTRHASALGRLVVYRVRSAGAVEVAGGNNASAASDAVTIMRRLGARFVAIDGAAGRRFSCAPSLVEATVLATGAVLAETMEGVVRRTAHAVDVLTTAGWESPLKECVRAEELSHRDVLLFDTEGEVRRLTVPSVLLRADEIAQAVAGGVDTILLGGALTGSFVRALLRHGKASGLTVVARDATRILAGSGDLVRFWSRGGQVAVMHPVRLVAVTTNPTAPDGRLFDPHVFLDRIARALAPIPAFDVVAGESRNVPGGDTTERARRERVAGGRRLYARVQAPGEGGVA
ncbi:MAG: hypothetical protein AB1774_00575 [Bacillota bacterium]